MIATRSAGLRSATLGAAIIVAFSAPAVLRLASGLLAPTESRFGDAIASALGGVALPVLAAAIVTALLAESAPLRIRADLLVSAGVAPRRLVPRLLGTTLLAAIVSAVIASVAVVVMVRVSLRLRTPGMMVQDVLGTAWAVTVGTAAWTAIAAAFAIRSARGARAWLVVPIDLVTRLVPGALAWIAPSAHVANLLGAPPPRGFAHVPVLPQLASVGVLSALAVLASLVALRRYRGAPAR